MRIIPALLALAMGILALALIISSPEASEELLERPSIAAHDLGDDPILDRLWMECSTWNLEACEELQLLSGPLSEYGRFASEILEKADGS